MSLRYFSHDVSASRDMKCVKLINARGLAGYGLFWRIIETLYETLNCELEYDLAGLSALFNCEEELVRSVVEDFGLFTVSDGVFWSESAKARFGVYRDSEEAKKERRSEKCRRAGLLSAAARKAKQEKYSNVERPKSKADENQEKQEEIVSDVSDSIDAPACEEPSETSVEEEFGMDEEPAAERVIALWNAVFDGSPEAYRGLTLDPVSYARLMDAFRAGYSLDDIARTFPIARDDNFGWTLKNVLKPDNIQLLLTKGKKNEQRQSGSDRKSDSSDDLGEWSEIERRYLRDDL